MIRRTIPAVAILAIAATMAPPVSAGAGGLHPAFSNTIEMTYPDGRTARLWLEADGRYSGEDKYRRPSSGRWSVKSGKLCMRQKRPLPVPFSYCTPLVAPDEVGVSWLGRAVTGETLRIRLVAGR
jgi:hypothetical protein